MCQVRATALFVRHNIEACAKAFARQSPRHNWPETNVGASKARDAPRGRRSISQALHIAWQPPVSPDAIPVRLAGNMPRSHQPRFTGKAVVYFICSMAKLEVMFDNPSVLVISFL